MQLSTATGDIITVKTKCIHVLAPRNFGTGDLRFEFLHLFGGFKDFFLSKMCVLTIWTPYRAF